MRIIRKIEFAVAAVALVPASLTLADPTPDRRYELGEIFRDCSECPEMVVVPAGSFTMGSPKSERYRIYVEGPQHRVTFSQPFAVGRFAVTFDEWDACVADGGCKGYKPSDADWGRGKRPVVNVSWDDAQAYISWLKGKTERNYHLLKRSPARVRESQQGTTTPFWVGSSISTSEDTSGQYRKQTVPVGLVRHRIRGASSRYTATCGSGPRIAGVTVIGVRRLTVRPDQRGLQFCGYTRWGLEYPFCGPPISLPELIPAACPKRSRLPINPAGWVSRAARPFHCPCWSSNSRKGLPSWEIS